MKQENISKLKDYLINRSSWVTASELASYLHTTPRTVQNYIREINSEKKNLIISSQDGYLFNPGEVRTDDLEKTSSEYDTPMKRVAFIVKRILFYGQATYEEIADELFVSESTIDSDMQRVKNEVSSFNVRLRKRGNTFTFSGQEINLRQLIYHCIRLNAPSRTITLKGVMADFPLLDVSAISRLTDDTVKNHGLRINELNYYYFISIICIQISRIINKKSVTDEFLSRESLRQFDEYRAAQVLASSLSTLMSISFSESEICYLAVILISFCLPENEEPAKEIREIPDLHLFTVNNLHTVFERMKTDLSDESVIRLVEQSLLRMIIRKRCGFFFPLPFTYNIRKNAPLLINYLIWVGEAMSEKYGITVMDDDISLLAFILSRFIRKPEKTDKINTQLIVPDFENIRNELVDRISSHYADQLNIMEVSTRVSGSESDAGDHLTVSVYPLDQTANTVVISPFFTEDDQYIINNAIHRIRLNRYIDQLLEILEENLTPEHLQFNVPVTSRHRILNEISLIFNRENAIREDNIQQLLKRERISPTSFNNMMAMPHITTRNTERKSLFIIINSNPFDWGEARINMLICAIWPRSAIEEMQEFYQAASMIFSSPLVIRKILNAVDLPSFISVIRSLKSSQ